jgi:hypothetical protein
MTLTQISIVSDIDEELCMIIPIIQWGKPLSLKRCFVDQRHLGDASKIEIVKHSVAPRLSPVQAGLAERSIPAEERGSAYEI